MYVLIARLLLMMMLESRPLTADTIMAKVAANQDVAEKARGEFTYTQHLHIVTRKANKKVMREEILDLKILPAPLGTQKIVQSIRGRYWHKGKYIEFYGEPVPGLDSVDGSIVHNVREDIVNDKSADGLGQGLFPLTTEEQRSYEFSLVGQESMGGREVYRIEFKPKSKDEVTWSGEVLVDMAEFQPLYVSTRFAHRLPSAVRILLGTDLPGIGFSVRYEKQSEGVWFPVSFGSEFRMRAIFILHRNISVSLQNGSFERAHLQGKSECMPSQ